MSKVKSKGAKDVPKTADVLKTKDAGVTTSGKKSKDVPKQVVKEKKKKVREPTPESESESDESESEEEPVANGKANGVGHESDESDSSESSVEAAKGVLGKAPAVDAASSDESDSDASDEAEVGVKVAANVPDSDSASDGESDEETLTKAPAAKRAAASSGSDSDASSDESEEEKKPVQAGKRKAEDDAVPVAKKAKADTETSGNLFVGNLSWNVDEDWLRQMFESYGELAGVRVITDRATGRSKGFGYVEFVNGEDAAKAHEELNGTDLDGRAINVDFASQRSSGPDRVQARAKSFGDTQSPATDTLFVGNLPFDAGQDAVSSAFGEHGTILGVRLPTDRESGQPKGFGYVTFASVEEAQGALEAMQGYQFEGRTVRLDYSQPRPAGDSGGRGRGGFGGRGRGGFDRGGRGGFGDRGGRGRGGFGGRGRGGFDRGGRGSSTNRGGFGDYQGKKVTF